MATFAESFCQQRGIPKREYERAMFRLCLHRRARPFVGVIRLFNPEYFNPDYELIGGVAVLTVTHGLRSELHDFDSHPRNRGFLRRRLKFRVSARRVADLVRATLSAPAAGARDSHVPPAGTRP